MTRAPTWLMTLALITPFTALAESQTMTRDQTAALAAISTMTEAFQAGDIATVMDSYVPGAAVAFEPAAPVTDATQLRAMFTAMSGAAPVFAYPNGHEVIVSGDVALHISPWAMQATGPDGTAIEQSGLSVAVLLRQADGDWKMVIDNPHGGRLLAVD